jgi:hypothetical protein
LRGQGRRSGEASILPRHVLRLGPQQDEEVHHPGLGHPVGLDPRLSPIKVKFDQRIKDATYVYTLVFYLFTEVLTYVCKKVLTYVLCFYLFKNVFTYVF